jgi:hypothetical protein
VVISKEQDIMFEVLSCIWLVSTLFGIVINMIMAFYELPNSKGGGTARFEKFTKIIYVPTILSGLSLGILTYIAFAEKDNVPILFRILVTLFFGGAAASVTFYGSSYFVKNISRVVIWIIDKNHRQENKIAAIEWTMFIGLVVGIIVMLLLLIVGTYEFTRTSILLCVYTPILSVLVAMGFAVPVILVIRAYSGKWENGKWVKK